MLVKDLEIFTKEIGEKIEWQAYFPLLLQQQQQQNSKTIVKYSLNKITTMNNNNFMRHFNIFFIQQRKSRENF